MAASDAFAAGDIVLVPFPFSDRLAEKRRPAVVVSRPETASRHGHVWLAMITSAAQRPWETDVAVADLALAGLSAPSVIRTAKIATTASDRILRRLGRLSVAGRDEVRRQIVAQLG